MARAATIIVSSLVIAVTLMMVVPIIGGISTVRDTTGGDRVQYDAALFNSTDTFVSLDDAAGTNDTVYKTTGFAANFSGADDSNISGAAIVNFGNSTDWHVSVWARADAVPSTDRQVIAVSDGELIIYYNASQDDWVAWYYKESSRDSYEVSINAPAPATDLTNIQVAANGSHLIIYRNTTSGGSTTITSSSTVSAPATDHWDGRVEELRVFDNALNQSQRSDIYTAPVEQRPGYNRTARLMFDQPGRAQTIILPGGQTATASNATFSSGFGQQVMDPETAQNNLLGNTDYRWENDGPQVAAESGGELDGAPVAYASYDVQATGIALTEFVGWLSIAALLPMVMMAAYIIGRVR